MANILELSVRNFDTEVLESKTPVLVDFWAPWCAPCRAMAPVLETVSQELAGKVKVVKVNVDDNQQLAARFAVQAIPTLVIFKGGKPVDRIVGGVSRDEITRRLSAAGA